LLPIGWAVALLAADASASPLYSYDFASLVFSSEQIVEGRPVGSAVFEVRVVRVHAGSLKIGQTIRLLGTGDYDLRPAKSFNSADLLFLFLRPDHSPLLYGVPSDPTAFVPLPSGIKVVDSEHFF